MKTASKFLSMLLLVAMCLSLLGGSAFALGLGNQSSSAENVDTGSSSSSAIGGLGNPVADSKVEQSSGTSSDAGLTSGEDAGLLGAGESEFSSFDIRPYDLAPGYAVKNTSNSAEGAENVAKAKEKGIVNMTFEKNVDETESLSLSGNTIDLAGHSWKIDDTKTLTISGDVTISNGSIITAGNPIQLSGGTLTLNNVVVTRSGNAFEGSGKLVINNDPVSTLFGSKLENRSSSNTTINSGKFSDAKTVIDPLVGSDSVASTDGAYTVVTGGVYVFQVGSEKFVDFNSALAAATPSGTISVIPKSDKINVPDMTISGQNVRLVLNGQEVKGNIVVNSGTLTLAQGQLTGNVTVNGGSLVLDGSNLLDVEGIVNLASGASASVSGNVVCKQINALTGSTLNISGGVITDLVVDSGCNLSITGGTIVEHKGGYTGQNVRGGKFRIEPGEAWLAPGYEAKSDGTYYVVSQKTSTNTVVPYPDASAVYVYDLASSSNAELFRYKVNSGASVKDVSLLINGTSYPVTWEEVDSICRVSSATFKTLPADKAIVRFTFDDGTVNEENVIYIFPIVNADDLSWTSSSTKTPVYFIAPNGSFHGYSLLNESGSKIRDLAYGEYSLTSAPSGVKLSLSESLLKTLKGTFRIGFNYADNYFIMDAFSAAGSGTGNGGSGSGTGGTGSGGSGSGGTVVPGDVAIWPADSSTWYSGDGMKTFYYRPAIDFSDPTSKGLWIDGWLQDPTNWVTNNNSGTLKIGTAILNNLSRGWHTVSINTVNGVASCDFYVGATLRPVDTDKHVIGSSKNLQFVCSDSIQSVYINGRPLTDVDYGDYWTLSYDRKTVTLTAKFLNNRTAGETYSIGVVTTNGDRPSCNFKILTTAQASASPGTGDASNLALWAAVLVLSGGAAVAVLPRLKKHEN